MEKDSIIAALKYERDELACMFDLHMLQIDKQHKMIKSLRKRNGRLGLALGIETLAIIGYLYYRLDKKDREYQKEIEEALKDDELLS